MGGEGGEKVTARILEKVALGAWLYYYQTHAVCVLLSFMDKEGNPCYLYDISGGGIKGKRERASGPLR